LSANFTGNEGLPPTTFGVRKLRVPGLSRDVVCVVLLLAVLTISACDRQTQSHTDRHKTTANTGA